MVLLVTPLLQPKALARKLPTNQEPARDEIAAEQWEEWATPLTTHVARDAEAESIETQRNSSYVRLCSEAHVLGLTAAVSQLQACTTLVISPNMLHRLPDAIGRLPVLTSLDCSRNLLAELPRSIGALQVRAVPWCRSHATLPI